MRVRTAVNAIAAISSRKIRSFTRRKYFPHLPHLRAPVSLLRALGDACANVMRYILRGLFSRYSRNLVEFRYNQETHCCSFLSLSLCVLPGKQFYCSYACIAHDTSLHSPRPPPEAFLSHEEQVADVTTYSNCCWSAPSLHQIKIFNAFRPLYCCMAFVYYLVQQEI